MVAWYGYWNSYWSDVRLTGRGFESSLGTIVQWPWASYLHLCASVTKQYNLCAGQRAVALQMGSTDKRYVRAWVADKTVLSPCYTQAVSDFSLLSCVTAY